MLQLYTANFLYPRFLINLKWRSSSFRLHQVFPTLIDGPNDIFPNSTGPWPGLQKGRKIPDSTLVHFSCCDYCHPLEDGNYD